MKLKLKKIVHYNDCFTNLKARCKARNFCFVFRRFKPRPRLKAHCMWSGELCRPGLCVLVFKYGSIDTDSKEFISQDHYCLIDKEVTDED